MSENVLNCPLCTRILARKVVVDFQNDNPVAFEVRCSNPDCLAMVKVQYGMITYTEVITK